MESQEYWNAVLELSRKSGDCHQALWEFLQKNPMPIGDSLPEYNRLREAYVEAFTQWINFSESHERR